MFNKSQFLQYPNVFQFYILITLYFTQTSVYTNNPKYTHTNLVNYIQSYLLFFISYFFISFGHWTAAKLRYRFEGLSQKILLQYLFFLKSPSIGPFFNYGDKLITFKVAVGNKHIYTYIMCTHKHIHTYNELLLDFVYQIYWQSFGSILGKTQDGTRWYWTWNHAIGMQVNIFYYRQIYYTKC